MPVHCSSVGFTGWRILATSGRGGCCCSYGGGGDGGAKAASRLPPCRPPAGPGWLVEQRREAGPGQHPGGALGGGLGIGRVGWAQPAATAAPCSRARHSPWGLPSQPHCRRLLCPTGGGGATPLPASSPAASLGAQSGGGGGGSPLASHKCRAATTTTSASASILFPAKESGWQVGTGGPLARFPARCSTWPHGWAARGCGSCPPPLEPPEPETAVKLCDCSAPLLRAAPSLPCSFCVPSSWSPSRAFLSRSATLALRCLSRTT